MKANILAVLFFLLFLAGACKNDQPSITGKWHPVDVHFKDMPDEDKKEYINSSAVEFTKDGGFIALTYGKTKKGTYTFNKKTNVLVTSLEGGEVDSIKTEWIGNKLLLTMKDESMTLEREK